ncbi:MAG: glutamate racemase [Bacteroidales bacterium]|nr:glutamate racemase [Bacteroidales bacterium]
MKIGVIDSGLGGLSVLKELVRVLPDAEYIYYADSANIPYGTKTPEFIRRRTAEIVSVLVGRGVGAVVVACNTATAAAIASLREAFPIPFVGMEPAVKPAATGTACGVVGVLATAGTLAASRYLDMRDRYAGGVSVVEHVGEGFVELVESGELDGERACEVVGKSLRPLLDAGADTIVLGCTHYPFLLPVMRRIAGPEVRFIDPAPAVARQLLRVLGKEMDGKENAAPADVTLLSSGDAANLRALWKTIEKSSCR